MASEVCHGSGRSLTDVLVEFASEHDRAVDAAAARNG